MLYLTTRNPAESFTSHRALHGDCLSDGGQLIPMQTPVLLKEDILLLGQSTFSQMVAKVLNLFFDKQFDGWDIEFVIGRSCVKYAPLNHRITVAKLWYNREQSYKRFEKAIYEKLAGSSVNCRNVPQWPRIAIRIAVLFGIAADLAKEGISCFDVAVPADELDLIFAIWYAKQMGLPVGAVLCGSVENSAMWELLRNGEICNPQQNGDTAGGLEQLFFDLFGRDICRKYAACVHNGGIFRITEEQKKGLNSYFFISVASKDRINGVIRSVYSSSDFLLDPSTAVSYSVLQDYRAKKGEGRMTLILADESPLKAVDAICKATGLSAAQLKSKLNA